MLLRLYFGTFTIPHLDALYDAVAAEIEGADLLIVAPGGVDGQRHGGRTPRRAVARRRPLPDARALGAHADRRHARISDHG